MIRPPFLAALLASCLVACTGAMPDDNPWPDIDAPRPERLADGTCQAREVTPAVYEHVMGEVQVVQAEIAEDGTVLRPPIYRRAPVPRVVTPREELIFASPCPEDFTTDFVSTLQRALAARGVFHGPVSGMLDAPTTAAIRTWQTERGLPSGQLSLETARFLGIIATPIDQIEPA
ncbi:peptidoglycan-binding protein [Citreicella sp. C3M06]|uniref:peptidoglycan-binding domain-containing protein n=1 Tax=Roseobacteraceae TaxID=2854170 RepID=UPI001C0A43FB|nr:MULTISPECIES: peptidoglycan-binding domain-containing protein [Roseobacteraceae]MBU2960379.1 peptidoglycan-binding protein [Citreicella sp. C3M06]MDO6585873.1 peptidoglycan-binding domain-containing protein [Salipiger sp. 1_MG-2023]